MTKIADRRVQVRDDGFGKSSKEPRAFSEFADANAVILLGNPGAGKSTLFSLAGGTNAKSVRSFLLAPALPAEGALFLDGLDEYRKVIANDAASDRLAETLIGLGKPKFRLSCRASDWFDALDQNVMSAASATGRVVVLDLLPLNEAEIRSIVSAEVDNPDQLIAEAKSFGIAHLLGNPQTLDLMLRAWKSGKRPRNKFEAYHFGIENLLVETNAAHQARGGAVVSMKELRRASGAACATLLLADAEAVSRVDTAPHDDDLVSISSVPYDPTAHVDFALARRVFTSAATDLFQPVHRTIAEFLGAEFMADRIRNCLPVTRALALMCAPDGAPISALRGLFAWLMCHLGADAEPIVARDPYAIATYGDGACLPPAVQITIWSALVKAPDPWFLSSEEERGAFNGLANKSTRPALLAILKDPQSSSHLVVACLEAIAAATDDLNLEAEIAAHAFAANDNTWLRSAALRALLRHGNPAVAEDVERRLAAATYDLSASSLRIKLLRETARPADFTARVISILEQFKASRQEQSVIGSLYPLREIVRPEDLDTLLDAAVPLLPEHGRSPVELEHLFKDWLIDRLGSPSPLDQSRVLAWLRAIKPHQSDGDVDRALAARMAGEPGLLGALFDAAIRQAAPESTKDVFRCLRADFVRCVPDHLWPSAPHKFLFARAVAESNAAISAGYFQEAIWKIPKTGYTLAEAEAISTLLDSRPDLAAAASGWEVYQLEAYELEERERKIARREQAAKTRADNVQGLAPKLVSITSGTDVGCLKWAVQHYGRKDGADVSVPLNARLVTLTDETTAAAIVAGFSAFIDTSNIPTIDSMRLAGRNNSYSNDLVLLMLSASIRLRENLPIPAHAEPVVAAGVIVNADLFVRDPEAKQVLADWFAERLADLASPVRTLLADAWQDAVAGGETNLPCFFDLSQRPPCAGIVSSLISPLFTGSTAPTSHVAQACVRHLVINDPGTAQQLVAAALISSSTTGDITGLRLAAAFVTASGPVDLVAPFAALTDAGAWAAIDLWRGDGITSGPLAPMTTYRTAMLISAVGARFPNAEQRLGAAYGQHNDYDAAEFVAGQIKHLASLDDVQAGQRLAQLAGDPTLTSYRNLIRHHLAQRLRQRREKDFEPPDREHITTSLLNAAPANTADLLAVVVDHFEALAAEIRGTSYAGLNAYWSDKNRSYEQPKDEPVCSKLLAADLQKRVASLGLAASVEHHMIAEKRCDIVVLQAAIRLLPIEVKHHYHADLWTAWRTQLDKLYASDVRAQGVGIYCVLWSGETDGRRMPTLPAGITRPTSAAALREALTSIVPADERNRLRVVVVDISPIR